MRVLAASGFTIRGDAQHAGIGHAGHTTVMGAREIGGWFHPAKANDDFVVEIGVIPRQHAKC
jgi:hypothetical protein